MIVRFFAHLKSITGCSETEIVVPEPISAEELWTRLENQFPGLAAHTASTRLAINAAYAEPETRFADSDEVALIPPVSGG